MFRNHHEKEYQRTEMFGFWSTTVRVEIGGDESTSWLHEDALRSTSQTRHGNYVLVNTKVFVF